MLVSSAKIDAPRDRTARRFHNWLSYLRCCTFAHWSSSSNTSNHLTSHHPLPIRCRPLPPTHLLALHSHHRLPSTLQPRLRRLPNPPFQHQTPFPPLLITLRNLGLHPLHPHLLPLLPKHSTNPMPNLQTWPSTGFPKSFAINRMRFPLIPCLNEPPSTNQSPSLNFTEPPTSPLCSHLLPSSTP